MNEEIRKLEPQKLWNIFADICNIPHPSKKEAQIIEFAKNFGENLGLETIIDEVGNVIIKKPATPGMEDRKGIILQGHLDMVPQKNNDTQHDFEKDPINTFIDGEWVTAKGTTLGADNGIGAAAAMAVLSSNDIEHGPIEALLTIDEETGMTGAFGLKPGLLDGDILMNLDSEDEGELYVGCAGGMDAEIEFTFTKESVPAGMKAYKINVKGLKGGHSGMDIILGRGNANKILIRLLKHAVKEHGLKLASIEGGSLRNAIPREAFATVVVPENKVNEFETCFKKQAEIYKAELAGTEPDMDLCFESCNLPDSLIDEKTQNNLINGVYACPNGVMRMSDSMPGVAETSTNLAIVKSKENTIDVMCLMRSSVDTAKDDLAEMINSVFTMAGAKVKFDGAYPGWKPNPESPILKAMLEGYNNKYGKTPEVKVIHAGLECGILGSAYPNWDMISFGPTIRFPHSPDEKVNIATVEKFYEFLLETLKNAPKK